MVTCREIVEELFRIFTTCLSWFYALALVLLLLLRLLIGDRFWLVSALGNFTPYCFAPLVILIGLGLVARVRWALLTTIPLLVIGILMFRGYFVAKNPPPANGPTLHVAIFNVYRFNTAPGQIMTWMRVTDADFIMLQEVPQALLLPLTYQMADVYPQMMVRASGDNTLWNILLSRYPILSTEDLTSSDSTDTRPRTRYVIERDGQQMAIYNLDFAPPTQKPRFELPLIGNGLNELVMGYDDSTRNQEIHKLLDGLRQETLPYIVAGNFAMSDQTKIYNEVKVVMGDSFRETASGFGGTWPVNAVEGTFPRFVPPLFRVDYIWHSPQFRAVSARVGKFLDSNHLPLEATLEILPG